MKTLCAFLKLKFPCEGVATCLVLSGFLAAAQSKIEGRFTDVDGEPLSYGSVVLLHARDSTLAKGAITDEQGKFIIENVVAGNYVLISSLIGYKTRTMTGIQISGQQDIDLGPNILEENTTQLNEVVIKAEKPMFEQHVDRFVLNIQNSITFSGNTVLDILQKSPGVMVDRQGNNINLNGKSGVRVMINDKIVQLPMSVVIQMLEGMSSNNVEKIEFITTPPAKYDAEGNAGIIHIVLKENADMGTTGSLGLTLGYRGAEVYGGNFNIAHRTRKFAYTLNYSLLTTRNVHYVKLRTYGSQDSLTSSSDATRDNITPVQNFSGGIEWNPSKNTSVSIQLNGYRNHWEMNAITHDMLVASRDSIVMTDMQVYESNLWQSGNGAIGLQTRLNERSEFSVSADYLYYHNSNPSHYNNSMSYEGHSTTATSEIDLQKATPIKMLVGKADYSAQLTPGVKIETGIKYVTSDLDNDVQVQRLDTGTWYVDEGLTSYSMLSERVGAAYSSLAWDPLPHYHLNGGLRYEYTRTTISTPAHDNLVDRKYGYWFPSIFIKRDISSEQDLQFSYSRRITRPTYNDIAPFVFFWSPTIFSAGNTSLWPSISDALQASYHIKQWTASLQYSHVQREISFFQPEKDDSDNLIYRSQNMRYVNTLALVSSYAATVTNWWEISANITARYQVAETAYLPQNTTVSLYGATVNLTNVLTLPKDFSIEVSGFYQSQSFLGISMFHPLGSLNIGIQKKIGTDGTLKLAVDDLLHTNVWRLTTELPQIDLNTTTTYDFNMRFIRLVYSLNFGNKKLRSVNLKSGSVEEKSRVQ